MSQKQLPLVTIAIACYNSETTISNAIDCALKQDYPNTEIIILDDCSQDSSIQVINDKIFNVKHAKLISHSYNTGFAGAINDIIQESKGDYITFFDDDDISYDNRISSQLAMITSFIEKYGHNKVLCFGSRRVFENNHSNISYAIGRFEPFPNGQNVIDWILWKKPLEEQQIGSTGTGTMFAPLSLLRFYQFNTKLRRAEDFDLIVRCAQDGCYFIGTSDIVIDIYKKEKPYKNPKESLNNLNYLLESHKSYLKSNKVYAYAKLSTLSRHIYNHYNKILGIFMQIFSFLFLPKKYMIIMIKNKILKRLCEDINS